MCFDGCPVAVGMIIGMAGLKHCRLNSMALGFLSDLATLQSVTLLSPPIPARCVAGHNILLTV